VVMCLMGIVEDSRLRAGERLSRCKRPSLPKLLLPCVRLRGYLSTVLRTPTDAADWR
jgi:hypothetical protein